MRNKVLFVLTFAAGAIIGSGATWYYTKTKYDQLVAKHEEEIQSVKEVYATKQEEKETSEDDKEEEDTPLVKVVTKNEKPDMMEYANMLNKQRYSNEQPKKEAIILDARQHKSDGPHVISPEDFGEYEEYEMITLYYYADGILTDTDDEIIDDVEEMVGYDSFKHFGEYEDDSVYVRNDEKRCDYEILRDERKFADVYNS